MGRYVEPDRIGLEGGLNPYIYADGNPMSNIDPDAQNARRTIYTFISPSINRMASVDTIKIAGLAPRITPDVIATSRIRGISFTDVNQRARPEILAQFDNKTLIAERALQRSIKKPQSGLANESMASAHAEIGILEQARVTFGSLKGEAIFMNVNKLPCGYCLGDVAAEAKLLELSYLRINTVNPMNGYPASYFWRPGMNSLKEVGLRESLQGIPYTWQMIKQGL